MEIITLLNLGPAFYVMGWNRGNVSRRNSPFVLQVVNENCCAKMSIVQIVEKSMSDKEITRSMSVKAASSKPSSIPER